MKELNLTIGIFFDGTGNNAFNLGGGFKDCTKKNKKVLSCRSGYGLTSYSNDYTNIYHLYRLYQHVFISENAELQVGIYIEGTGTETGSPDDIVGMALGVSGTGVISKANKAVEKIPENISAALSEIHNQFTDAGFFIKSVQFDLFGFSRGAAAARHLANRIQSGDILIADAIRKGTHGTAFKGDIVGSVRFIGILDTVTATGVSLTNQGRPNPDTSDVNVILLPGVAKRVFHIIAAHECRSNFVLNSVTPIWPELSLPGVHSDIGGGYLPVVDENFFLSRPEVETVLLTHPENQTRVYAKALKQVNQLSSSVCFAPFLRTGEVTVETWSDERMRTDHYGQMQKRSFAAVTLRNRRVLNDWAKVVLRVMLDAAKDAGAFFEDVDNDIYLRLPDELLPLCQKARSQGKAIRSGITSVPFTKDENVLLENRYIHCSANWNAIDTDNHHIIGSASPLPDISFVNRPGDNWQRVVYDVFNKAI